MLFTLSAESIKVLFRPTAPSQLRGIVDRSQAGRLPTTCYSDCIGSEPAKRQPH
jgi:hypothetical protein